jgi:hypothetical protein
MANTTIRKSDGSNKVPVKAVDLGDGTYAEAVALQAGSVNIGDVDVLTLPGGLTGYAEDAAHTSGDIGVQALAVRKDSPVALGADGDYTPLQVNAVGQAHVAGKANVFDVTLVLDTSAYADGDCLSITVAISNFFLEPGGLAYINGIRVIDIDNQGGAFDMVFFDANTSVGTLNNAAAIDDAGAATILGWVDCNAADYTTWITNVFKTAGYNQNSDGWHIKTGWVKAAAGSTTLYLGTISRDAKTYSAGGLKLKIGVMYP